MEENRVQPQSGNWCFGRESNRDNQNCCLFDTQKEFTKVILQTNTQHVQYAAG